MSFFQNPFVADFEGNWLLGDRQYIPKFVIPGNKGRTQEYVVVNEEGPYNLSGNDLDDNPKNVLNISFALHDFKNWSSISITITASSLANTTEEEIVNSLNDNEVFYAFFIAEMNDFFPNKKRKITIKQRHPVSSMIFYINNGQAESVLSFNKLAAIREIPSFFNRHTIANRNIFPDSANMLIELDINSEIDSILIDNAGFNSSTIKEDYELLAGKSGLFIFTKQVITDGNIVSKIEYHAGSKVGDLAKKTTYSDFTGSIPGTITEVPYVLQSADLI